MSFQEKRAIVSLISTILIAVLYCAYMVERFPLGDPYSAEVFRFWGAFFLILIPVTIVAKIAIHILFSILNTIATREDEPSITDERDRLIEMRALTLAIYSFSLGFLLAMIALVIGMPPSTMFVTLICSGVTAEIISDFSQFSMYRRGF
jgi:hypothetical protein